MKRPHHIDLNDIIQHPGRRLTYDVSSALEDFPDVELHNPITGQLTAYSTGSAVLLNGDFHAQVWVECSRCALRFAEEVNFHAEDEFEVEGTPAGMSHHSHATISQGEEPYPLFHGNQLLTDEFVHQHLVLNLPIQPLCREECKGLCGHCGQNLNEGDCDCVDDEGHPAFAELADRWKTGQ